MQLHGRIFNWLVPHTSIFPSNNEMISDSICWRRLFICRAATATAKPRTMARTSRRCCRPCKFWVLRPTSRTPFSASFLPVKNKPEILRSRRPVKTPAVGDRVRFFYGPQRNKARNKSWDKNSKFMPNFLNPFYSVLFRYCFPQNNAFKFSVLLLMGPSLFSWKYKN